MAAEYFAYFFNQLKSTGIVDPIENAVGLLVESQQTLFPQNCQMLGYIALCRSHLFDDFLHTCRSCPQNTQNLETYGMRHCLQASCCMLNIFFIGDQSFIHIPNISKDRLTGDLCKRSLLISLMRHIITIYRERYMVGWEQGQDHVI